MNFLRHYLLALQFFTRVPVTGRLAQWVGFNAAMQRASVAHLPGVGWLVGAVSAGVYAGAVTLLPAVPATPLVAAVAAVAASAWMTGALHEDGLADVVDGLGGSADRERALAIMKDSRVGAFGALALLLVVLARVGLLAVLGGLGLGAACAGLLAGHVLSRLLPVVLMRVLPYAGALDKAKAPGMSHRPGWLTLAAALLWCAGLPVLLAAWGGVGVLRPAVVLAPLLAMAAALWWLARLFQRRLAGITGDCLGASQQVGELAFLAALACAL